MRTKTIASEKVWKSPDGQKSIWEVTLETEGKQYHLKTYSPKISELGFEGEVESYISQGGDRFVKQLPQKSGGNWRDDNAIRAQWAIGQAIAYASATMRKDAITMAAVEEYGKELYAMVERVKGSQPLSTEAWTQPEKYIQNYTKPTEVYEAFTQ